MLESLFWFFLLWFIIQVTDDARRERETQRLYSEHRQMLIDEMGLNEGGDDGHTQEY